MYTIKKPCENSATSKPAPGPVVPLFPHLPDFEGHNSEKMRNWAGIIQRLPTGMNWTDMAMLQRPKADWDVVWDMAGGGRDLYPPQEGTGNKEELSRAYIMTLQKTTSAH